MSNLLSEKREALLLRLGENLRAQREVVFSQTTEEFSERFGLYGVVISPEEVAAMEAGSPDTPISFWMAAFQIMQVSDAIVAASKSNAALFLASAKHVDGIEEEVRKALIAKGSES